jgi:putative intracellular protease/amidase
MSQPKRILFVVSNPAKSSSNGMDVGYWLPELAHPYHAFQSRGYRMTIALPKGGAVTHDKISDPDGGRFANPRDLVSLGFKAARPVQDELAATRPLVEIRVEDHDVIFVIGGLAPPVTFTDDENLHKLFAAFHDAGKLSVAICHGSLVLLKATRER